MRYLWLFETGVCARFEVPKVGEDALFELFHVLYRPTESVETEDEGADDVGAGDVVEAAPKDTGDVFGIREEEAVEGRVSGTGMADGEGRVIG